MKTYPKSLTTFIVLSFHVLSQIISLLKKFVPLSQKKITLKNSFHYHKKKEVSRGQK